MIQQFIKYLCRKKRSHIHIKARFMKKIPIYFLVLLAFRLWQYQPL
jgi:hypothetical protein